MNKVCAVLLIDSAAAVIQADAQAEQVFGRSVSDLHGARICNLFGDRNDLERELGPGDIMALAEHSNAVRWFARRSDGAEVDVDVSFRKLGGGVAPTFLLIMQCVGDDDGAPIRCAAWQRVEETLQRDKVRLADAAALAQLGYYERIISEQRVEWSPETFRILDRDPALGQPDYGDILRSVHPEDRAGFQASLAEAEKNKTWCDVQFRIVCRNGEIRWIHSRARPILNAAGELERYFGVLQDITGHRRALEELANTGRRLKKALELTKTTVFDQDSELRYTRIFNSRPEFDPVGKSDIDLLPFDYAKELVRLKRQVIETGEPAREDVVVIAGGQVLYYDLWAEPHRNEHGKPIGVMCVAMDITERKNAEFERRRLDERIREAQKLESLGVLAAGIAHDFNNYLMGILGHAEILLVELPQASVFHEDVECIRTAALRAADLCKQLLAYAGKDRIAPTVFDLPELIREITQLLEVTISKQIAVRYESISDVPTIEGDAVQIRQLVMNLITNASEAIGEASGTITISTGVIQVDERYLETLQFTENLPAGRYVYFSVTDTGCGMDDETRARIFEPFFTTKRMGRGLGLSAAVGIVRRHRGALQIQTQPGQGTTFKVLLPSSEATAQVLTERAAPREQWRGTGTVLLVDDEEMVRSLGTKLLERMGFSVVTAPDGRAAMKIFKEKKREITLVLLDMMMPHLDGQETYCEIRRLDRNIPIVMTSGYGPQGIIDWFVSTEPLYFIQKPFRQEDVLGQIRTALDSQRKG